LDKVPELPIRGAKKLPEKLLEHRDMAYLSRQLATIKVDCELDVKVGELMPGTPDRDALIELYRSLEFKAWLDELLREAKAAGDSVETVDQTPAVEAEYETILDQQRLDHWLQQLREARSAVDSVDTVDQTPAVETAYETLLEQQRLDPGQQQLREAPLFAFDTETTSQDAQQAELVGVTFAVEQHRAAYVPLAHSY